jgi:molecular chaperone GrpE
MAEEQTKHNESQVETPETEAAEQTAQAEAADAVADESSIDVAQLQQALVAAQEEAAGLKDQALRAVAEAQNARRRAEQDVEKAHKFGSEKLINEMLPIIDSLERALEACQTEDESVKALREGVEMTYNMFVQGLAKFSVEQVNPKGEAFNPELHQAMTMVPSPGQEPNTVLDVMQKGYTLHGRLIRPAMVVVVQG